MNRLRRYIVAGLLALAGFFFIIFGINRVLANQQDAQLAAVYHTTRAAGGLTEPQALRAGANLVYITPLGTAPESKREKLLRDTLDQQRSLANSSTVLTVDGHAERVYIGQSGSQFVGIWQRRATLLSVAPGWLAAIAGVYGLGVAATMGWFARRQRYWTSHLEVVGDNVEEIRLGKPLTPMIFTPGSAFAPVGGAVSALNDDVARLREKVALRQASFDRLIGHLPQGVMLLDADRTVVLANRAMSALVGHPIADTPHNYLDDIKTYALARMIEHTYRNQRTHHKELTLLVTQKAVDASVIALEGGDRLQVLVILYDVTYLRQVEQMQLDFVGNVSHELKTPITAIQGFAETLLEGAQDDAATRAQFLGIIRDESKRLTQLITDILTLSRPDAEPVALSTVNLGELVAQTTQSLAQPIAEKQLTVVTTFAPDFTVTTVAAKLSQIMRNLLTNAVFYNRDGGSVTVGGELTARDIVITVADTGIGIAEADQARIFERFYRVDKARSRHNGGTGLGLAIVFEMVQQLGGELAVASQLGGGTTFNVTLPRTDLPSFYTE